MNISNTTMEIETFIWPLCDGSEDIASLSTCNDSWIYFNEIDWSENVTNYLSCSDDVVFEDIFFFIDDLNLNENLTEEDGRNFCSVSNENYFNETKDFITCKIVGHNTLNGQCNDFTDNTKLAFWLAFVVYLILSVSKVYVYLLVCHVPFIANGAVRILHRAINHMTDQQIYFQTENTLYTPVWV